jgi:8-oxo-dGTP diphosphatase
MGAKEQGADSQSVAARWQVVPRTLCFVTHGDDILLLKRSETKRIYPGYYNGLGGHIERDEDPLTGAIREIHEEAGLIVKNVRYCGSTHIDAGQDVGILLFIFVSEATSRDFGDCDEGTLEWIPLQRVLANDNELLLVEDLPIILPRLFATDGENRPFFGHVSYDEDDKLQLLFADSP